MKSSTFSKVLKMIAAGALSRADAAAELGCSPRHVNRLMADAGVARPPGVTRAARAAARESNLARQGRILRAALQVSVDGLNVATAAARAGCSERTIYRYRRKK